MLEEGLFLLWFLQSQLSNATFIDGDVSLGAIICDFDYFTMMTTESLTNSLLD